MDQALVTVLTRHDAHMAADRDAATTRRNHVSARNSKAVDLTQGLLIAFAAMSFGVALILGDISLPKSASGGSVFVLAGLCWATATLLKGARKRDPA